MIQRRAARIADKYQAAIEPKPMHR